MNIVMSIKPGVHPNTQIGGIMVLNQVTRFVKNEAFNLLFEPLTVSLNSLSDSLINTFKSTMEQLKEKGVSLEAISTQDADG